MTTRLITIIRPTRGALRLNLRELWRYRELLALLVRRDFVANYKQTILGPAWFLLQPLLLTLVFTLVFGKLARLPTDGTPPLLFYLCGMLPWTYASQTFTANASVFMVNQSLFSKVYFPRLVVPLAKAMSNMLAATLQLVLFAGFWIWFKVRMGDATTFHLTWGALLLPLLMLQCAAAAVGCGLLMSALTARYRDFFHMIPVLTQVWLYATPVIYPWSQVPGWAAGWLALNPLAGAVECYRWALLGTPTPDLHLVVTSAASAALLALVGFLLFQQVERTAMDTA